MLCPFARGVECAKKRDYEGLYPERPRTTRAPCPSAPCAARADTEAPSGHCHPGRDAVQSLGPDSPSTRLGICSHGEARKTQQRSSHEVIVETARQERRRSNDPSFQGPLCDAIRPQRDGPAGAGPFSAGRRGPPEPRLKIPLMEQYMFGQFPPTSEKKWHFPEENRKGLNLRTPHIDLWQHARHQHSAPRSDLRVHSQTCTC